MLACKHWVALFELDGHADEGKSYTPFNFFLKILTILECNLIEEEDILTFLFQIDYHCDKQKYLLIAKLLVLFHY